LTFNIVKSHFSFISCTDIVQVFQSVLPHGMIAKNGPWRTEGMLFGSLWHLSIFDGMESISRAVENRRTKY
jgi:hypothetical protein